MRLGCPYSCLGGISVRFSYTTKDYQRTGNTEVVLNFCEAYRYAFLISSWLASGLMPNASYSFVSATIIDWTCDNQQFYHWFSAKSCKGSKDESISGIKGGDFEMLEVRVCQTSLSFGTLPYLRAAFGQFRPGGDDRSNFPDSDSQLPSCPANIGRTF